VTLKPVAFAGLLLGLAPMAHAPDPLPPSSLAVWHDGSWREWWRSAEAPVSWQAGHAVIQQALEWSTASPGVEWTELRLAGAGEAWRIRLIVARLDPRRLRFRLDTAFRRGARPDWSLDRVPGEAVFAVNAGQFSRIMPWGWVVLNGREYLPPGRAPLSDAVAFDSLGGVRWMPADSLVAPAARRGTFQAFQSYPVLLRRGVIPEPLRMEGRGVDLAHRDARAAIGRDAEGSLLVVLSRFDVVGGSLGFLPFGLTTAEMAAVMGAIGARDAVMLDGGISSQLLIRDQGALRRWRGLRRVPLGLVAFPRT
jgi:hypothetical protein